MARTADAQATLITGAAVISAGLRDTEASRTILSTTRSFCDLVLTATFSVAPTAGDTIDVFRRDMNIDGTADAPVPALTSYENHWVGSFIADGSLTQSLPLNGINVPNDCEFYLINNSAQNISAGWTLKAVTWDWV